MPIPLRPRTHTQPLPAHRGAAQTSQAPSRNQGGFDSQRFTPATRPGPQGHPDISWPSTPLDAKGRPFEIRGATDAHTGKPMAYEGPRVGTETGSPTYLQSNRNQLAAKKNEAQIAHLTFPQDRALKKEFLGAKYREEQYAKSNAKSIKREIASGHRDDAVPMQKLNLPSLQYQDIPKGPVISGPISGRPIDKGYAATKLPENPAQTQGEFLGLEHFRNEAGAGSHRDLQEPVSTYRAPLHFDRLVQMDDMVNKAATAHVNKPGRGTEKTYKQALHVRETYEKHNKQAIAREKRSGAWMEAPIGANHPDYRHLDVEGGHVHMKDAVAGRRVPGSADQSVPKFAPGVSAYAHQPDTEALQARLARLRGHNAPSARGGMEAPMPRRAGGESPVPRPQNPLAKLFEAHPDLPESATRVSRGTQTEGRSGMTDRGVQTDD